jgi:hypothetical protein
MDSCAACFARSSTIHCESFLLTSAPTGLISAPQLLVPSAPRCCPSSTCRAAESGPARAAGYEPRGTLLNKGGHLAAALSSDAKT